MNLAYLCIGILAFLVVGGGFGVSMQRRSSRTSTGVPDDPTHGLTRWSRAHGNTIEYAPMIAIMIGLLASSATPIWVTVCMVGATASRVLIFGGLALAPTLAKPNQARFIGALGTYLFGLGLVVAVIIHALGG